jgi:hypothetical protein
MKITYTGCYTDTLRGIKVFLDIGPDQPNTVGMNEGMKVGTIDGPP